MRTSSPLSVRRLVAGGVSLAVAAAMTLAGSVAAEASDTSCAYGTCYLSFAYTGTVDEWVVPANVTSIDVVAAGASGGASAPGSGSQGTGAGGDGGAVHAVLPVTPGEKLSVVVGGVGETGLANSTTPAAGGFGGGASAGARSNGQAYGSGGGGGGGTFLFSPNSLLIAAGGGGGGSSFSGSAVYGGAGGSSGDGKSGSSAYGAPSGGGATDTGPGEGGAQSYSGASGSSTFASSPSVLGKGGAGANSSTGKGYVTPGGGGGGADTSGAYAGAGGGGSGFVIPTATDVYDRKTRGGVGRISISYTDPNYGTALTLKASDNPTDATPTELTASITPASATGSVSFSDGDIDLGSATLANGTAMLKTTLSAGAHNITASYASNISHGASTVDTTVTVFAHTEAPAFAVASTSTSPIDKIVTAGEPFSFTDLAATGAPTPTYAIVANETTPDILDDVAFTDGALHGLTTVAGTWQVAIAASNSVGSAMEYVRLTVTPGPTVGLEAIVTPGNTSTHPNTLWIVDTDGTVVDGLSDEETLPTATINAHQGDAIAFKTIALDRFGNHIGDAPQPVTTSSVETDTISYDSATNLTTVRFNHASPHTISFTVDGITNSFTVQVIPAASANPSLAPTPGVGVNADARAAGPASNRLATTGSAPLAPLGWALGFLAAGIVVTMVRRHMTRRID